MRKLILLFIPFFSLAQTDSTDLIVERMMKKQKVVGLSLAVIKNGHPVVNKGYGLANVELNIPVTSESVLRIGSVSKQFFATAIIKLMQDGKLSIEDPVHKYFPDAPETWRPIKIKHLLTHSSGLKREGPAFDPAKVQPDLVVIKSAYTLPLDFKTSEKYQYCNLGYFMLADIIRQVSGVSWQQYIHDKLFVPAGMMNSHTAAFYDIIPNRSSGYMYRHDTLVNSFVMFAIRPSGGFQSTASDMIKWEKAMTEKKIILKKENWEMLLQEYVKISAKADANWYYGFGWVVGDHRGHKLVQHGGSTPGFKATYLRFVNDDTSIIVLANTDEADPEKIGFALADYYFSK